jgi:hypothetical protein
MTMSQSTSLASPTPTKTLASILGVTIPQLDNPRAAVAFFLKYHERILNKERFYLRLVYWQQTAGMTDGDAVVALVACLREFAFENEIYQALREAVNEAVRKRKTREESEERNRALTAASGAIVPFDMSKLIQIIAPVTTKGAQ